MTIDLDALVAEARMANPPWEEEDSAVSLFRDLADALEQSQAELRTVSEIGDGDVQRLAEVLNENLTLKAELRQERERADEVRGLAAARRKTIVVYTRENAEWELRVSLAETALSRAEETIDRAIECLEENEDRDEVAIAILTDYDKTKKEQA